jgi:hypothetical protein
MSELIELKVLSNDALPIDENDWGSERQMEAETKFWDALKAQIGEENYDKLSEDIESLKMDVDAMIYFALTKIEPDLEKAVITIMKEGTISQQSEAHQKVIMDLALVRSSWQARTKGSKVTYE